jgi:hypothetical protein
MASIQQEAFLFSNAIGKRIPQVSERLMDLMLVEPQDLLEPETLKEVVVLLRSVPDLMEQFGRLFLPEHTALEMWTDSKGESYAMLVTGDQLERIGALSAPPMGTPVSTARGTASLESPSQVRSNSSLLV